MKKNWLFVTAILCMATLVSKDAMGASGSASSVTDSPQKKERKIKIMAIKDGKMMEKDSTIVTGTGNQVFVVGSSMSVKADSMYHDLGNGYDQKSVTVTVTDEGDKNGKGTTYTYSIGDTLKQDVSGKSFRLGNAKHAFIMRDDSGENAGMPAMSAPVMALTQQGTVLSTINVPMYTYVEVAQGKKTVWLAATSMAVKKGDTIHFDDGMAMNNFYSKSLKRNFPSIIFVNRATVGSGK